MKLYIIKIGGNIIDDEAKLSLFLQEFAAIDAPKILVHGGGKMATRMAAQLGLPQEMQDGRRITDAATLQLVTMVYAGYINKNIVSLLQSHGCNALGLTGADGNAIRAHKRIVSGINYGFAGDVDEVNATLVNQLLAHHSLVFAPITHDAKGQLLNTNADTIAQELARAMSGVYDVSLIYCFEKQGVLLDASDDESVIPHLSKAYFEKLQEERIITEGMIPKLHNAFSAVEAGVQSVTIGDAAQLSRLIEQQSGTTIKNV